MCPKHFVIVNMATIGIDTDAIVQGGRTWAARNILKPIKRETFGIGKDNIGYNRIFKAFLITEALDRENSYTQEQIQCLESELLGEIQTQENLQGVTRVPQTIFPPAPTAEPIRI